MSKGIIGIGQDGDVRVTVRNRRTVAGIAGQRDVLVDVEYVGPDWGDSTSHRFTHSTLGGPVVAHVGDGAQVFVRNASDHGDTCKLDAAWLRSYYRLGE